MTEKQRMFKLASGALPHVVYRVQADAHDAP